MEKLVWTVAVTLTSALAATLTARAMGSLWQRATGERPPEMPRWARWLVARPLRAGVGHTVPSPA